MTYRRGYFLILPAALFLAFLVGLGFLLQPALAAGNSAAGQSAWTPLEYTLVSVPTLNEVGQPLRVLNATQVEPTANCTADTSSGISNWPLNESAGATTFEDVFGVNDGACTSGTCPTATTGKVGGAFAFNALDLDKVDVDTSVTDPYDWTNSDSFSFEMWVNTTQDCTGNKVFLGRYRISAVGNGTWWVGCTAVGADTGLPVFSLRDSAAAVAVAVTGTTNINNGAWHHIVALRDNTANKNQLYVDGVLAGEVTPAHVGGFSSDDKLTMGYYNNSYYLNGTLDEVAVWDKALSTTTITAHYNAGAGQSYCNDAPDAVDDTQTATEDTPLDFAGSTLLANDTDVDGNTLSISDIDTTTSQGGTVASIGGGNYRYTPPADFSGDDTYTYTASDGLGGTDTATVTVTVGAVNDAPEATNPGDQTNDEGDIVSLQIVATDADTGDTLTYSAANLPTGLSIEPDTGLISGTIAYTASAGSVYASSVTVTDAALATDTVNFDWTVNDVNGPPEITQPGNQTNVEGAVVSLPIEATDPDEDTLLYEATGLPPGLSIDSSTGLITGVIGYDAQENSPYTVTVKVSDDGVPPLTDQAVFTWTITDTNQPPIMNDIDPQTNDEGDTVSLATGATDPDGNIITFSAQNLPPALEIDPDTGDITGTIDCQANGGSPYTVIVTATDNGSPPLTNDETFSWTVNLANCAPDVTDPGDQSDSEGSKVSLPIQAVDGDGDVLTFTAAGLPPGLSINLNTGVISGTIVTGAVGNYSVSVTVSDGTAQASVEFAWEVTERVNWKTFLPFVREGSGDFH